MQTVMTCNGCIGVMASDTVGTAMPHCVIFRVKLIHCLSKNTPPTHKDCQRPNALTLGHHFHLAASGGVCRDASSHADLCEQSNEAIQSAALQA